MLAARQLRRAIQIADRMHLAYESGVTRVELGHLLSPNDTARGPLLEDACRIFDAIGAVELFRDARALGTAKQTSRRH